MADKDELFGNTEQLDDTIGRRETVKAIRDAMLAWSYMPLWREDKIVDAVKALPSAQETITYRMFADSMLKMWMDNVLTDGEYNRIMDKLNAHWGEGEEHGTSRAVLPKKSLR